MLKARKVFGAGLPQESCHVGEGLWRVSSSVGRADAQQVWEVNARAVVRREMVCIVRWVCAEDGLGLGVSRGEWGVKR